jgi:hypothetical protein
MKINNLLIILFIFLSKSYASNLCLKNEENVLTFVVKNSKKIVSICEEINSKYLVYRFGTVKNIELSYPKILDESSWNLFKFNGIKRFYVEKPNDSFGEYMLKFSNEKINYKINLYWKYNETNATLEVIKNSKKTIFLSESDSIEGSLDILEIENERFGKYF